MTRLYALFLIAAVFALCPTLARASDNTPPKPIVKLGVLVVFDQLRGDYLEKWRPQFGDDGFKRMQDDGAWFKDCHYPYATTTTGPGHASILAGCGPNKHGIVNNEWYDAKSGETVYCAALARYSFVPAPMVQPVDPKSPAMVKKPRLAGAPDHFLTETVADQLKLATKGKGKVFGLSLKDRSALLPAGRKPDGVYWFDRRFVTSTYYRDTLHPWVDTFNKAGLADEFFDKDWVKFKPELDYEKLAGPDDAPGEGKGTGQGVTFPHPTTGGKKAIGKEYFDALANTPYGNDLLLAFAKECIVAEKLGTGENTDLLTLSFSSNDLIGHNWGPDSQEVMDVTLRSDAIMADLLKFLDDKVGKGKYVVVLTADHGICPLPENSAKNGIDAKRLSPVRLILASEKHLSEQFGAAKDAPVKEPPVKDPAVKEDEEPARKKDPSHWIESVDGPNVYVNRRLVKAKGLDFDAVTDTLAEFLRTQDGILRVYNRKQMEDAKPSDDAITNRVKRSYYAERSGDLYVVMKPYYLMESRTTGTTHGAPHSYDTHVPLLVFGPGVPGGVRTEKVTPLHAAPIMADFIGANQPADCDYDLPKTLRKK